MCHLGSNSYCKLLRTHEVFVNMADSSRKPVHECHLDILSQGTLADLTFIVGPSKDRIMCHRVFLAARSPVLETMCSSRWHQDEVPLPDVDPKIFKKFLEFIYADVFVASVSDALELIRLAHMYDIQSLVSKCEQLIERELTLDIAVDAFQVANEYDKIQLIKKAGDLLAISLTKLQSLPSFSRLDRQTLVYLLQRNDITIKEVELFRLALQWARNQSGFTVEQSLEGILPLIRFPIMTLEELRTTVFPSGVLSAATVSELSMYLKANALGRESMARTLQFSTQLRRPPGPSFYLTLYPGNIEEMIKCHQQFGPIKESLQFVFRTNFSTSELKSQHGRLPIIGLTGISIYCPAAIVSAGPRRFDVRVIVEDFHDSLDLGENPTLAQLVAIQEGKFTKIAFDRAIPMVDRTQYCIKIQDTTQTFCTNETNTYETIDFGDCSVCTDPWIIGDKRIYLKEVRRNGLDGFCNYGSTPKLIYRVWFEEV